MNAPLHPERLLGLPAHEPQTALPLETEGVQRYVWEGRFGAMLIEVRGAQVYVNGEPVQPHEVPKPP